MTETTTPITLKHAAARLHAARERAEQLATYFKAYEDEFREIHAELLHQIDEAKIDAREAEDALRAAGFAEYEATGTKKLPCGLGVRVITKLDYDPVVALEWAKAHGLALTLDTKAFEKIAKADRPDFVSLVEVPTVTLPSDSAKLLGG